MALSPDTNWLTLAINEEGASSLRVIHTAAWKLKLSPTLPHGVTTKMKWSPDSREFAFSFLAAKHGKQYVSLDNEYNREDSVKDIGALRLDRGTRKDLDSSRIMVTGGSYRGYMTLASMIHYGDRIRCA